MQLSLMLEKQSHLPRHVTRALEAIVTALVETTRSFSTDTPDVPDIGEHSDVKMPMAEHALQHPLADLLALLDAVGLHAHLGQLLFPLLEPPYPGAIR